MIRFSFLNHLPFYALLICLASSCNQKRSDSTTMTKEIDSIVVAADTVITEQSLPFDSFYEAVSLFSADHPHYKLTHGQLVDTLRDYSSHWLLGKIEKARRSHQKSDDPRHRRELSMLPDSIDYGHIEFIRQGAFYFGSLRSGH